MPTELRHEFVETLNACERQTLDALETAIAALDRTLEAVSDHDAIAAQAVIAGDASLDGDYTQVKQTIVHVLATQAPVAGDLRTVLALLETIRSVERIGDQCANIAKLVRLTAPASDRDPVLLDLLARMGVIARERTVLAKEAFELRSLSHFDPVAEEFAPLSRRLLHRAVVIGDRRETREWAMSMVLVARALRRIAENARAIAEQVPFVASGQHIELPALSRAVV